MMITLKWLSKGKNYRVKSQFKAKAVSEESVILGIALNGNFICFGFFAWSICCGSKCQPLNIENRVYKNSQYCCCSRSRGRGGDYHDELRKFQELKKKWVVTGVVEPEPLQKGWPRLWLTPDSAPAPTRAPAPPTVEKIKPNWPTIEFRWTFFWNLLFMFQSVLRSQNYLFSAPALPLSIISASAPATAT